MHKHTYIYTYTHTYTNKVKPNLRYVSTIWNPPLSVSRFLFQFMKLCRPPSSATIGVPKELNGGSWKEMNSLITKEMC